MKQGQFPAILSLGSLNGQNGFKIDGETAGDLSGFSLAAGGDINGDGHSDLLIGAYGYNGHTGRSYVIWGGKSPGGSGLISLSSLNSTRGVKIDGEVGGDYAGSSISSLGDINLDGYADFIIGANQHGSYAGRNYVVYGAPQIGSGGLLSLSGLNGVNGFKIDGEGGNDYSGTCVSAAGDVNGDGLPDILVGEPYYGTQIGRLERLFFSHSLVFMVHFFHWPSAC